MLLNSFEKLAMNNPVRSAFQRHLEARRLLDLGGPLDGGRALEIGCGRGVGARLILELFNAGEVDAFDLDPEMVALAEGRLRGYGDRVRLWTGDATAIEAEDRSYDAVFDFGIIHHIPSWRRALAEVRRVLVPGGRFYCEEVYACFIRHPLWRTLLDHPQEDRFDHRGLREGLFEAGLRVVGEREGWGRWMGWFVATREGPTGR